MPKLLLSTAPVWLTLFWATAPPIHAQPTIVAASSPSAKYIYTFSGAIQVQFGATDLLVPGNYQYAGLPFPPNGRVPPFTQASLSLSSSGDWIFLSSAGPSFVEFNLSLGMPPQLPAVGTKIVYLEVVGIFGATLHSLLGSATLTISQAAPPGVPAPGTLLLLICGLGGLGMLAPKLRTA